MEHSYLIPSSFVEIPIESPFDKMPFGIGEKDQPFTTFELDLYSGDRLYLYTDGFTDQFGGPKGKKFMYKQLHQALVSLAHKNMKQQSESLNSIFEEWRGKLEQVDDVCVVGINYSDLNSQNRV